MFRKETGILTHFSRAVLGKLSPSEFRDGLRALNIGISATQIESLLKQADSDGDGLVDYYEFAEQVGAVSRAKAASHSLAHSAVKHMERPNDNPSASSPKKVMPRWVAVLVLVAVLIPWRQTGCGLRAPSPRLRVNALRASLRLVV